MGALISLLVVVGLALIYLEFFIPSGLLGVVAAILLITSIIMFGLETSWSAWTAGFGLIILAFTLMVCRLALRKVKKKVSLKNDQQGFQASTYDANLIGKEGVAMSDLKPSGHIMVGEKQVQALSETGYIVKGTTVVVVGGRGSHLIIKRKEPS